MNVKFDYLENVPNIAATICDKEGNVAGLIELAIDQPDEMPVFNRDKE